MWWLGTISTTSPLLRGLFLEMQSLTGKGKYPFRKSRGHVFFLLVVCCQVKRPRGAGSIHGWAQRGCFLFSFFCVCVCPTVRRAAFLSPLVKGLALPKVFVFRHLRGGKTQIRSNYCVACCLAAACRRATKMDKRNTNHRSETAFMIPL